MKKFLLCLLFAPAFLNAQSGHIIPNPLKDVPPWVRNIFTSQHLNEKYTIIYQRYPILLKGDFNGDGRKDVVLQIQESISGKNGIAIFHQRGPQALGTYVVIFGAGKSIDHSPNNFKDMTLWSRIPRNKISAEAVHPPLPTIKGDIIRLQTTGGKTAFIYWNGKQYIWYVSQK
jgi:hypothetical protein